MPPPKRPASPTSSQRQNKRTKASSLEDNFDAELDKFLKLLDVILQAYSFVPLTHPFRIHPMEAIPQAIALKVLIDTDRQNRREVLKHLRATTLAFHPYSQMRHLDEFKSYFPIDRDFNDTAASLRSSLKTKHENLCAFQDVLFDPIILPTPSAFSKPTGWPEMQANSNFAILCHRPADNSPSLPLKVKHPAFHKFFDEMSATPTVAKLGRFRMAAMELGLKLSAPSGQECTRGSHIHHIFLSLFPESDGYTWALEDNHKQGKIDLLGTKVTADGGTCSHIMIEVKLEPGTNGDGQLQICRMYDVYVRRNNCVRGSGAPMFLLSISGMSAP